MKLKEILSGIEELKAKGNVEVEINNIQTDSRKVAQGDLFVAIKGFEVDGHQYIKDVIVKGASAILINDESIVNVAKALSEIGAVDNVTLVSCPDTRVAVAKCACNYYDNPSRKFKLVGITGTKGKTTTSFMVKQLLEKQGLKVGLLGTIAVYIGDKKLEDSDRTTPDSVKLQSIFAQMANEKCDVVVMEVSSQSLKLHRVDGSNFDIGVFTNLSEDHISKNEHPDMEDYFNSKVRLFEICKYGYVNADDLKTRLVPGIINNGNIQTYGIDNACDILAKDITITNSYVDFRVRVNNKNERIRTGIPGRFSVYNTLAALSIALRLGCDIEKVKEALETIRVPGRNELVDNKLGLTIMVDYAHSPKSLESILQSVKEYTRGRVISVFGCGGDRDSSKRPAMGEISGKIADYTIITSDNPRTEDPQLIVDQIEEGIKKTKGKYEVIVDRTEAIKKAIKMAKKNDLIVLAGKGHETYQEINHEKYPYDERIIIKEIIDGMEEAKNSENSVKADSKGGK